MHRNIIAFYFISPIQRSQFEELQTAWKHQCAADIKGNSSSFKLRKLLGYAFQVTENKDL